ncbi:unnamed protein product [Pieris macdunnoughi]|uniref:Uncharacterized protein n=1 Tax=Pieris macdunnoughi TaxID=345717 RepID=A0A821Y761_9NEOP|nr:unnamed protein product [Pieris macdunnoughi]
MDTLNARGLASALPAFQELLRTGGRRGDTGGISYSASTSDDETQLQVLIRTTPLNTLHGKCGRRCRVTPHLYATPKDQAARSGIGRRRFEPLFVEYGQVEGVGTGEPPPRAESSTPRGAEFALYMRMRWPGVKYRLALLSTPSFLEANLAFPSK